MRVLALEPFYGGSHRAFLDGWRDGSRHQWTLLTLPPRHWKWRMRHAGVTLASQVIDELRFSEMRSDEMQRNERRQRGREGQAAQDPGWDVLWASDMLPLAELRGLVPGPVAALPAVLYMHENQLTYPDRGAQTRDLHFAFSNLVSAFAAQAVWFNSEFHRREMLSAAEDWLRRMPDYAPLAELAAVQGKSRVLGQGITPSPARPPRPPGPLRIVWAARWEHDKNPEDFFAAVEGLHAMGSDFRLAVLGQRFRQTPPIFDRAHGRLAAHIDHWGFIADRQTYLETLAWGDVVVSTAHHEFFGVSVVEAIAAGCVPLLPNRLAYPEILAPMPGPLRAACSYAGSVESLQGALLELQRRAATEEGLETLRAAALDATRRFHWPQLRPRLDDALEAAAGRGRIA